MKKKAKQIVPILLTVCVLISVSIINSFGLTHTVSDYHYFFFAEDYLRENYPDFKTETVDGVLYAYVVEDGVATILNIQTNHFGPDKFVLTLPLALGGYPVTAIGDDEHRPEVFLYLSFTDDIYPPGYNESTGLGYSEYDPGLRYMSQMIIPEGYEYIHFGALNCVKTRIIFPKSMKQINHIWYMGENLTGETTFLGNDTLVFPESKFGNFTPDYTHDSYIIPSRDPDVAFWVNDNRSNNYYNAFTTPQAMCFPYNAPESLANTYFYKADSYFDPDSLQWVTKGFYKNSNFNNTVIYCASDSPLYNKLKELEQGGYGSYTINTNIPKAEYIAFPSDVVNVNVGDVMDLEAKTYPAEAIWTACDYTVSDPSIVKIDEYSGRITALKEGTVTVTATHCERGYVDTCTVNVTTKPAPGVNGIEPATDTPYVAYGNRDYKINVTGSPSKIQVVRDNGGTTTIDRRRATVTSNGDTETWIVNMRVEAGSHNIRAKYGKVWEERLTRFTVEYDLPGAYSLDLTYEDGIGTFEVVTDPEVIKVQLALDNGCTLTYSQVYSHIGEDGLRHWTMTRKLPADTKYTLKTKYGYTWTTTEFTVST